MDLPARVKITKNLISLEKGEKLLLVNGAEIKPLLVNRGKDHVVRFLKKVDRAGETRAFLQEPEDEKLLRTMIGHNILIADHDDEKYCSKGFTEDAGGSSGMSLYLLVSQGCNLSCVYSLNGEKTYQKTDKLLMEDQIAYKAVDVCLGRLKPRGSLEIVFFGGEPLLN